MSLIRKIDLFTNKRIKYIQKYINEINNVQLIKKQLGGTEETIDELFQNLNNVSGSIGLLISRVEPQIEEAKKIIKRLEEQNKTCNENLEKKTKEIENVRAEILNKHSVLEKLLGEHADELFKAKMSEYGKLDYYLALPEHIKKILRTYKDTDLPIFFNRTQDIPADNINELNEIVRSIEVRKFLIENVIDDVIRSYDKLQSVLKKRLHKLTNEAIQSSINNAFSESRKLIDEQKLNKLLTELYRV